VGKKERAALHFDDHYLRRFRSGDFGLPFLWVYTKLTPSPWTRRFPVLVGMTDGWWEPFVAVI